MKVPDAVVRAVLEHLAEEVVVCDPTGRIVRANEAWREGGLGPGEFFVTAFDEPELVTEWVAQCLGNPVRLRVLALRRGVWCWVAMTALVDEFRDTVGFLAEVESAEGLGEKIASMGLTPREKDVAYRLLQGFSSRRIAEVLGLSEATVKTHTGHVYRKTGTRSRFELAALLA